MNLSEREQRLKESLNTIPAADAAYQGWAKLQRNERLEAAEAEALEKIVDSMVRPAKPFPEATPAGISEGAFGGDDLQTIRECYARFDLNSFASTSLDWSLALSTCCLSHLVYSEMSSIRPICLEEWNFDACEFIQVNDTVCTVAANSDAIAVSFRGTASLQNWIRDLTLYTLRTDFGLVHAGFYRGFQQLRSALEAVLRNLGTDGRKLVLTGHSLGGAMATLAAAHWRHSGEFDVASIYTFGQPAVGKASFREATGDFFGQQLFRFVYEKDLVTRLPPRYEHVGRLVHLQQFATETLAANTELMPMLSEAEFETLQMQLEATPAEAVTTESLWPNFSDHKLFRYLQQISSKLE